MAERPAGRPPVNSNTSVPGRQHSKCCHVLGLQPFLALGYVELDLLPFHQSAVPFATNGAEVHEHIRTRLTLNAAKALGIVEPFNRTGLPIRHYHLLHITNDSPPPGKPERRYRHYVQRPLDTWCET